LPAERRLFEGGIARVVTELPLKGGPLAGAQPAHPPGVRDSEPAHNLPGADLANAWQGLQQSRDLHLADHVIGGAFLDDVGQGRRTALESILDLCAFLARTGRLFQGHSPLLRRRGWHRQANHILRAEGRQP
jgi:hypothetical protein